MSLQEVTSNPNSVFSSFFTTTHCHTRKTTRKNPLEYPPSNPFIMSSFTPPLIDVSTPSPSSTSQSSIPLCSSPDPSPYKLPASLFPFFTMSTNPQKDPFKDPSVLNLDYFNYTLAILRAKVYTFQKLHPWQTDLVTGRLEWRDAKISLLTELVAFHYILIGA